MTKLRVEVKDLQAAGDEKSATVKYAKCTIFSTEETDCPLCKVHVPAGELHECKRPAK